MKYLCYGTSTSAQTKMTEKKTTLELLSKGHTAEALDKLLAMNMPPKDRAVLVQIKASNAQLQRDSQKGILSFEQKTTEQNRINDRLLQFLNGEDTPSVPAGTGTRRGKWWGYVAGVGVVIGILAGIAELSGYSLRDFFTGSSADDTFTATVFVHGKRGTDERILKNQGQVLLGLRGNEMPSSINEKGEATFKEIPGAFAGKRVPIRINHPQPYRATRPDSLYRLEASAAIYVEVALEGTNRLFGKVMDFDTEQWLDSVRVSVENIATFTDEYGWFELFLPEDKQRKFQRVSFYKAGYKIEELDSIPVHTQQEIQVSLHKN